MRFAAISSGIRVTAAAVIVAIVAANPGCAARPSASYPPVPLGWTHEYHGPGTSIGGAGEGSATSLILTPNAPSFESPIFTARPSTEAILSWNVDVPERSAAVFELRVRDAADAQWSPWMFIGEVEGAGGPPRPILRCIRAQGVRVDIDYLIAESPFDRVQWRLTGVWPRQRAEAGDGTVAIPREIAVRRVDLTTTAPIAQTPATAIPPEVAPARVPVRISVPFRSQKTDNPALAGRLCSPTSVAMVLAHWHGEAQVQQVAEAVYDPANDVYGNWPRNVQAAHTLGMPGRLARFDGWSEVEDLIAAGSPVVISLKAARGELRGAPYKDTTGHLIVITGFDARGDVYVSDPSVSTPARGELRYRRRDLEVCWLRRARGTAYVFGPGPR